MGDSSTLPRAPGDTIGRAKQQHAKNASVPVFFCVRVRARKKPDGRFAAQKWAKKGNSPVGRGLHERARFHAQITHKLSTEHHVAISPIPHYLVSPAPENTTCWVSVEKPSTTPAQNSSIDSAFLIPTKRLYFMALAHTREVAVTTRPIRPGGIAKSGTAVATAVTETTHYPTIFTRDGLPAKSFPPIQLHEHPAIRGV